MSHRPPYLYLPPSLPLSLSHIPSTPPLNPHPHTQFSHLGFCFQVVSSSHTIENVQNSVFDFIDSIPTLLQLLPVSDYVNHVNSLISEKQKIDTSLYDAAGKEQNIGVDIVVIVGIIIEVNVVF